MRIPLLAATLMAGACYTASTSQVVEPTNTPIAASKPDETTASTTAQHFVRAVIQRDRSAVRAMFAVRVRVGVELDDARCQAAFGEAKTVSGDALDLLADCLDEFSNDTAQPGPGVVTFGNSRWSVELETKCAEYTLQLAERASGGLAIAGLAARSTCGGVEGGVVGGVVGGDINGTMGAPPPPPPPPPGSPQNVPPTLLEGSRISGNKMITPDDADKTTLSRGTKDRIIGSFKLCLDVNGDISQIRMLKSTGLPGYDAKLQREMAKWRYRPYLINGQAVPVCTAVTFIYSQVPPPPPGP